MKLFVIQPYWKAPSEVWMLRMIDMFTDKIECIATYSPSEFLYKNIQIFDINKIISPDRNKLVSRVQRFFLDYSKSNKLEQILNSLEINCVLVHYAVMAAAYKKYLLVTKKPLFIHCHGYDITWDLRDVNTPDVNYHSKEYINDIRELSSNATFIANSKYTVSKLMEIGIPENKIQLKYFGVPIPAPKTHIDKDYLNILFLGRLVDFKGPDLVIKAFDLASERGLKANLIIAGEGPLKITCELLKRTSIFSDRIHLVGVVDLNRADELRKDADIFTAHNCKGLLTHQEEAFGVSIVEAMAAELPVVSAKSGALEETVLNGLTGILVEQFDIESHAEAFLKLASNPNLRRAMGQKARERVLNNFTIEREKQRLAEILKLENNF